MGGCQHGYFSGACLPERFDAPEGCGAGGQHVINQQNGAVDSACRRVSLPQVPLAVLHVQGGLGSGTVVPAEQKLPAGNGPVSSAKNKPLRCSLPILL